MTDLDAATVLEVSGWDRRYAVVRAITTLGDHAAAVVDANGDGGDINLDQFRRVEGEWRLLSSSGGAGDWGRGWCDGVVAEHDRDENGWWLTLAPGEPPDDGLPPLPRSEEFGWTVQTFDDADPRSGTT